MTGYLPALYIVAYNNHYANSYLSLLSFLLYVIFSSIKLPLPVILIEQKILLVDQKTRYRSITAIVMKLRLISTAYRNMPVSGEKPGLKLHPFVTFLR